MRRKAQTVMIILPMIFVLAAARFSSDDRFVPSLSPVELEAYGSGEGALLAETRVKQRQPLAIPSDIRGPISADRTPRELVKKDTGGHRHVVTSIIISETEKKAVIDDTVVREGDSVDGFKVVYIGKNVVSVIAGGAIKRLKLEEQ